MKLIRTILLFISCCWVSCLISCVGSPTEVQPPTPLPIKEKIIWRSHEARPEWTIQEPEVKDDDFLFVGLSGKFVMEKEARDDAHRHAVSIVVRYISTDVRDKFERLIASTGLSTEVIDPTETIRGFEQQLSEAVTRRVKASIWYIEKWEKRQGPQTETYHLVYLLAKVPQAEVDRVIAEQRQHQAEIVTTAEFANEQLAEAKTLVLEADNQLASQPVQARSKYQSAVKRAETVKVKLIAHPELAKIIPRAQALIESTEQKMVAMLKDPQAIFAASVFGLTKNTKKPVIVAVAKVTYQETDLSSEFASRLTRNLEEVMSQEPNLYKIISQKVFQGELQDSEISVEDCLTGNFDLESAKVISTLDGLLFVRYWEKEFNVEIKLELIEIGQGTLLGAVSVELPKTFLGEELAYLPANGVIAQQALSVFAPRYKSGESGFKVNVWADKGKGTVYQKDELINFHFRSDKDCYIYLYHMDAGGQVKILFPNQFNKDNHIKANRVYTIPDDTMNFDFKITPPFGAEMLKTIASLQPLKKIDLKSGTTFKDIGKITEVNVREVINRSIEAVPQEGYAEDVCVITTIEENHKED